MVATNADFLRMAYFALNSTVGPERLCPMLLVFGAIPRLALTTSSLSQFERAKIME